MYNVNICGGFIYFSCNIIIYIKNYIENIKAKINSDIHSTPG